MRYSPLRADSGYGGVLGVQVVGVIAAENGQLRLVPAALTHGDIHPSTTTQSRTGPWQCRQPNLVNGVTHSARSRSSDGSGPWGQASLTVHHSSIERDSTNVL